MSLVEVVVAQAALQLVDDVAGKRAVDGADVELDLMDGACARDDGGAAVPDLARFVETVHGLLNVFPGQVLQRRVVDLVKVDVVAAQTFERAVEGVEDVLS